MTLFSIFTDLLLITGMIYVVFLQFFTLLSVLLHYKNPEFKDLVHKIYSQNSMSALLLAVPFLQYAIVHRLIVRTKEFGHFYMALRIGSYLTLMVLVWIEPLFAPLLIFYVNFLLVGLFGLGIYLNIGSLRSFVIKHFFNNDEDFEKKFLAFFFGNPKHSIINALKGLGAATVVVAPVGLRVQQDFKIAGSEARADYEQVYPSKIIDEGVVAEMRDNKISHNPEQFPAGWVYHNVKSVAAGVHEQIFPKASPEAIEAAKKIAKAAADCAS